MTKTDRPQRDRGGFTLLFTGLSGSGKTTLAEALQERIVATTGRMVTLLDGDVMRASLSADLGFSRADRDTHLGRIGWVASEISRYGGIVLCPFIAPYEASRKKFRETVIATGGYGLVYVSTPLAICEQRDNKGLYQRARAGDLTHFTGVSDPYEPPGDAAVTIDTSQVTVEEGCATVFSWLSKRGLFTSLVL